jgi:hypothetical protein
MLHPTEQYGHTVVVRVVPASLVGAAWASWMSSVPASPPPATAAPVVFRNPRLEMFMQAISFLVINRLRQLRQYKL